MADLTYNPAYFPMANGDAITAVALRELVYSETSPSASLAIVNGGLDYRNFATSFKVLAEHTQRGSLVEMESCAGTANLDYVGFWFAGYDSTATWLHAAESRPEARAIPGASKRIYVPATSIVRLAWTVFWTNDNDNANVRSRVFLEVDGVIQAGQMRQVNDAMDGGVHKGYARNRVWSGSTIVTLTEGWHDIAMKVTADRGMRQTRVWARSLNVLRFHQG